MRRIALLLLLLAPRGRAQDDKERVRIEFPEVTLQPVVRIDPDTHLKFGAQAALAKYREWAARAGQSRMPLATMAAIYGAAGEGAGAHATVAHLIETNQIAPEHNRQMAQLREAEVERLVLEIGREKGWRIARSDSGNVESGMQSDLDQTFYVFEAKETESGWAFERKPLLDEEFVREFTERWNKGPHAKALSLDAVDVSSFAGRNRFPGLFEEVTSGFWSEHRRVIEELRQARGAYTYAGATGQQMQGRAMDEIEKGNARAYQIYGPAEGGDTWRPLGTDRAEAIETMFGADPELRPGWSFDAAVANLLEMQKYIHKKDKFPSKYHLRAFEDGVYAQLLTAAGQGRKDKIKLEALGADERAAAIDRMVRHLYPDGAPEARLQRRQHAAALEVSVNLRRLHTGELEAQPAAVFEPLGRELYGDRWSPELVEAARHRHRQLASESGLRATLLTAPEAFAMLLDEDGGRHLDLDRYRKLLDVGDADWPDVRARLQDAVHLSFLFAMYDLGAEKGSRLVAKLAREHGLRRLPYLLWLWGRGQVQGLETVARKAGRYARLYAEQVPTVPELAERVNHYVLSELGYENRTIVDRATGEITGSHLAWSGSKLFRSLVYDPGHLDALGSVILCFYESDGDWEEVSRQIAYEMLLAAPLVGPVVAGMEALSKGDVAGLAGLGLALALPQVQGVLVFVSICQKGYAIYDREKLQPAARNAENAVYRGFLGPELRLFEEAPPEFTPADKAEIARLERELHASKRIVPLLPTYDPEALKRNLAEIDVAKQEYLTVKRRLDPLIEGLQVKRQRWKAHVLDPAMGGKHTGASAQLVQKPFQNYVLAAIEPVISFSPAGIVDFQAQQDAGDLERLGQRVIEAPDLESQLRAEAEYTEALLRHERAERAKRYLDAAEGRGGKRDGMGDREQRAGMLELRCKIKRDSLYPALRKLGYDDPVKYLRDWFRDSRAVLSELVARGLVEPDTGMVLIPGPVHPIAKYTRLSEFPADSMKKLEARIRGDHARSRILWERYQQVEQRRLRIAERALARRLKAFEAASAGAAVDRLTEDALLQRLLAAMEGRGAPGFAPPTAPAFEATVYRTEQGYYPATRIRANPAVFQRPYRTELRVLTIQEAWQALQAGRVQDHPLLPSTLRKLRELFRGKAPKEDRKGSYLFVVSALCDDLAPNVEGVPGAKGRHVIGQALALGWEKPEPEPTEIEWFVGEENQIRADTAIGRIAARYAEGRPFLEKRRDRFFESGWVKLDPTPYFIDWRKVERYAKEELSSLPYLGKEYYKPFRGTLECGGQVRHVVRVRMVRGSVEDLAAPYFSLPNGRHTVVANLVLEDGTKVKGSFRIDVRPEPKSRVAKTRADLPRLVADMRKDPRKVSALRGAYLGLADACLKEGHGPGPALAALRQAAELHDAMLQHGYSRPRNATREFDLRHAFEQHRQVIFGCRSIGSTEALQLATAAWEGARRSMTAKTGREKVAGTVSALAGLIITATGDTKAARPYWDEYLRYDPSAGKPGGRWEQPDTYWPR